MAIKMHILVCGGTGCSASASKEVIAELNRELESHNLTDFAKVVVTGCFGFCERGPIVKIIPLPITEIVTENEFFDYEAKYLGKSQEICPAPIPEGMAARVREASVAIYRHFGCNGVVRMDYIADGEKVYFLEVNTVPGMTKMSLIPNQARADGMSVSDFINILLDEARGSPPPHPRRRTA